MKCVFVGGSGGVIGKSTRGIRLECAAVCAHTGVRQETFEAVASANSFTNTHAALWMEEAAEPEQGVLGITQLIWGQTEDTCAPSRRPQD